VRIVGIAVSKRFNGLASAKRASCVAAVAAAFFPLGGCGLVGYAIVAPFCFASQPYVLFEQPKPLANPERVISDKGSPFVVVAAAFLPDAMGQTCRAVLSMEDGRTHAEKVKAGFFARSYAVAERENWLMVKAEFRKAAVAYAASHCKPSFVTITKDLQVFNTQGPYRLSVFLQIENDGSVFERQMTPCMV
jgi:hypothetical protein